MLLSIYISYRLGRKFGLRTYAWVMASVIILISLLSTFFTYMWLWGIIYPLGFLSFPFSSTVEQMHSPTPVIAYHINLLTLRIMSIAPQNAAPYGFLFFLLVNIVGAVLGYWSFKTLLEASLKRKMFDFFFKSGILSFLICYFLFLITLFATQPLFSPLTEDGTTLYAIVQLLYLIYIYFSWIPAVIATAIYGMRESSRARRKTHILESK